MFIAIIALFIIAPNWKQLKCPSSGSQMKSGTTNHAVEYCSMIKRNKLLIHITTWMHLIGIVLVEKACVFVYITFSK